MESNKLRQQEAAGRLGRWARNSGHDFPDQTGRMSVVIAETDEVAGWLSDPRIDVLRPDTYVFVRESRRGRTLPRTPGTWVRYRGALSEPGDEIQVGDDFWLQVTDYSSLRYLSISGPTVVRMYTPEDVHAYLADVRQARATGRLPEFLLHPIVELADRCLISGGTPCTTNGLGGRLYVAADRTVRTMPGGRIIGEIGDSRMVLAGSAYALTTNGDVCAEADVTSALRAFDRAELAGFLAAVDAMRVMLLRTRSLWNVSGLGFRICDRALQGETYPPRTDLLLLASAEDRVLYDARVNRGFKISPGMAEVLDVLLHTTGPDVALDRLSRCPNVPGDPGVAAADVCAELTRRGVDLPDLALAGAPR